MVRSYRRRLQLDRYRVNKFHVFAGVNLCEPKQLHSRVGNTANLNVTWDKYVILCVTSSFMNISLPLCISAFVGYSKREVRGRLNTHCTFYTVLWDFYHLIPTFVPEDDDCL